MSTTFHFRVGIAPHRPAIQPLANQQGHCRRTNKGFQSAKFRRALARRAKLATLVQRGLVPSPRSGSVNFLFGRGAGSELSPGANCSRQSSTQTSYTGCSTALKAGLDAYIQPRNSDTADSPGRVSQISKKAALSGVSSGGRLSQWRAMISSVPKRTVAPIEASIVETRAVTLSRPCRTVVRCGAAPGGVGINIQPRAPAQTAVLMIRRMLTLRLSLLQP